jgi:hypothetical protein
MAYLLDGSAGKFTANPPVLPKAFGTAEPPILIAPGEFFIALAALAA